MTATPLRPVLAAAAAAFALALAPPATAQTETAAPAIVLEIADAQAWRSRLGPTNVGALLDSEPGRALWTPLWEQALAAVTGPLGRDGEQLVEALLAFDGTLRMGATLDERGPSLAVVLEANDANDLAALAAKITTAQRYLLRGDARSVELGNGTWAVHRAGQGLSVSEPRVDEAQLTLLVAPEASLGTAASTAAALAATPHRTTGPDPQAPALHLHLDFARVLPFTELGHEKQLAERAGLHALGALDIALAARGPRLATLVDLEFTAPLTGLVKGLMPTASEPLRFVGAPPAGATVWKVGRIDDEALVDGAIRLASNWVDGQRFAEDLLGSDYEDRLLAPFTGEFMFANLSPEADGAQGTEPDRWVWALRAEKAASSLADGLEAMYRSSSWIRHWTGDEPREIEGVTVRRFAQGSSAFWLAHRGSTLVLADDDFDEREVTAQVTSLEAAAVASADSLALAPSHRPIARNLPPGLTGAATLDIETAFEGLSDVLFLVLPDAGGFQGFYGGSLDDDALAALRELLEHHALTRMQTGTGREDSTWRWRLFW